MKRSAAIGSALLLLAGLLAAGAAPANADADHKVTICHANQGVKGWSPNGNSVDKDSIMNPLGAGHDSHANDIIPAFDAGSHGGTTWDAYPGKNLNTLFDGVLGSVILANGCSIPAPTQDAAASATTTEATCDAPGAVTFYLTNATWADPSDVTDGSRTAIADAGHAFPGGAATLVVTYTIAAQLTGDQCAPPTDPQDAAASATPTEATCFAAGGVTFALTNATWENDTDLTDGSRTAIADAGHAFPGGAATLVVTYTIAAQLTGEQCQLDTHAQISTTATMQNLQCHAAGSYTLATTKGVRWLVNGIVTPASTYQVTAATTLNIQAEIIDTVANGWDDGAQTAWTFTFTEPADCLPTLAYTGTSGAEYGLLFASGLLLLGGVVVLTERRLRVVRA